MSCKKKIRTILFHIFEIKFNELSSFIMAYGVNHFHFFIYLIGALAFRKDWMTLGKTGDSRKHWNDWLVDRHFKSWRRMIMFWKLGKVFSKFETHRQDKLQVDNSIDFWEFANAPSKFDTCLQGNLQVEVLIKSLEMRQQQYLRLAQAPRIWRHVLLNGLVADAGKLRRLSCSQDDFIYFLPVAAT